MPPSTPSKSHPALLLVNQLEILETKLRVMELYVAQAQTAAAAEGNRARAQFQAEVDALRAELKQKTLSLETHQTLAQQSDRGQRKQIQELRTELVENNHVAEARGAELMAAKLAATALRERIGQLERSAHHSATQLNELTDRLASKQQLLDGRDRQIDELCGQNHVLCDQIAALEVAREQTLTNSQAVLEARAAEYRARVDELEQTVGQSHQLLQLRQDELDQVQSANKELTQQIERQDQALAQARSAKQESEQARHGLEIEHTTLCAEVDRHKTEATQRQTEFAKLSNDLHNRLNDLGEQLTAKQQIVKNRDQAIGELQHSISQMQEQMTEQDRLHRNATEAQDAASREREASFDARVQDFEAALAHHAALVAERTAELDGARSQIVNFETNTQLLQEANEQAQANQQELENQQAARERALADLQQEIEETQSALHQQTAELAVTNDQLAAQQRAHQERAAEIEQILQAKDSEMHQAHTEIADLSEQLTALEAVRNALEINAAQELAQVRGNLRAELAFLREELAAKENSLQQTHADLTRSHQLSESRARELENSANESRSLRERIAQLEALMGDAEHAANTRVEQLNDEYKAQQTALREQLHEQEQKLAVNQRHAKELELELTRQIETLQSRLTESDEQLAQRSAALDKQRSAGHALREEVARLEHINQEVSDASRHAEDAFHVRLSGLEATLADNAALLASRTADLDTAQAEITGLRQRVNDIQDTARRTDDEQEQHRAALHSELDQLRSALQEKETALAEQQTAWHDFGAQFDAQLNTLQHQLTEKAGFVEARDREIASLRANADTLASQLAEAQALAQQQLDAARAEADALRERIAEAEAERTHAEAEAQHETESLRQHHQNEISNLQRQTAEQAADLNSREAELRNLEASLHTHTQRFEAALAAKQTSLDESLAALQEHRSELATMQDRAAQLVLAREHAEAIAATEYRQLANRANADIEALKAQLAQNEQILRQHEERYRELQAVQQEQLNELHVQLAQKQLLAESLARELENTAAESRSLRNHIAQLEALSAEAACAANARVEQIHDEFEAQLAVLSEQLREQEQTLARNQSRAAELEQALARQIENLQSRLTESDEQLVLRSTALDAQISAAHALNEEVARLERINQEVSSAGQQSEEAFHVRLAELEAAAVDSAALLASRSAELEISQVEVTALRQRVKDIQGAAQRAHDEQEQHRAAMHSELAQLHKALQEKESAIEQQQTAWSDFSAQFDGQLNTLQQQLAEKGAFIEVRDREIADLQANAHGLATQLAEALSSAQQEIDAARAEAEALRQRYHDEISSLQRRTAEPAADFNSRDADQRNLEESLRVYTQRLESELAAKQNSLDESFAALQAQRSELVSMQERAAQLELARQQAEANAAAEYRQLAERTNADIETLKAELGQSELGLRHHEERYRALEAAQLEQLNELQVQLAQKQLLAESRTRESDDLRQQFVSMHDQLANLETVKREFAHQHDQLVSGQQTLHAQISALENQLADKVRTIEARDLEIGRIESARAALAHKLGQRSAATPIAPIDSASDFAQSGARHSTPSAIGSSTLSASDRDKFTAENQRALLEVENLRAEIREKHGLLEGRNEELLRVKTEMAALLDRIGLRQTATCQDEATGATIPSSNDLLWEQLGQNDHVEAPLQQAAVNDSQTGFRVTFDRRRNDLAAAHSVGEQTPGGVLSMEANPNPSQIEDLQRLKHLAGSAQSDASPALGHPNNRRWRFSLGKKRRWKP